jgi:hypothetical protein
MEINSESKKTDETLSTINLVKFLFHNKNNKIILHSLFVDFKILLAFSMFMPKNVCWLIWGGDLYDYKYRDRTLISNISELLKKIVIRKLSSILTFISGDYDLARRWYRAKCKNNYVIAYPRNINADLNKYHNSKVDQNLIQVGNSPDPRNNHEEVFRILRNKLSQNEHNYKIFCPLAYGSYPERIENLIDLGQSFFGKNSFIPLIKMLPIDDYISLLTKVRVAIFNHDRQQAIGNLILLLGLGKTVYIRKDIVTWAFCKDHGLIVRNIADLQEGKSFDFLSIDEIKQNKKAVLSNFNEQKAIKTWQKVFDE